MFACHSRSVCIVYVIALMTYTGLREQGVQRYANTYVDRQVGKPLIMFEPNILITFTFMHLADAFIQSDLQCIQVIHFRLIR